MPWTGEALGNLGCQAQVGVLDCGQVKIWNLGQMFEHHLPQQADACESQSYAHLSQW